VVFRYRYTSSEILGVKELIKQNLEFSDEELKVSSSVRVKLEIRAERQK
jgi:hypothetical protein